MYKSKHSLLKVCINSTLSFDVSPFFEVAPLLDAFPFSGELINDNLYADILRPFVTMMYFTDRAMLVMAMSQDNVAKAVGFECSMNI